MSWKAIMHRLQRLDGMRAEEAAARLVVKDRVDPATLTDEEWTELARLRHQVRPDSANPGKSGNITDAEWRELERLRQAARKALS